MITDYKILKADTPQEMESQVKAFLVKGYVPQGGVSITVVARVMYAQAMVKQVKYQPRNKK